MTSGLGQSNWFFNSVSYVDLRNALISSATTTNDAIAYSHLPNQTNEAVQGNPNVRIKTANMRASWDSVVQSRRTASSV